jgi:hypothetical protein
MDVGGSTEKKRSRGGVSGQESRSSPMASLSLYGFNPHDLS